MSRDRADGENEPVMNVPLTARLRELAGPLKRATGPLPRPTRRGLFLDVVLALVLGIAAVQYALEYADSPAGEVVDGVVQPWYPDGQPLPPGEPPTYPDEQPLPPGEPPAYPDEHGGWFGPAALAVLASAPLALRRRYPLAVLWIVTVAVALTPTEAPRITSYACVIAAYGAAAYSPYRRATLASLPVAVFALSRLADGTLPVVQNEYIPLLILVPIVVAANGLRTWQLRAGETHARMSALERERAAELRRAAEQERARIARELHDVVTHNVSVMIIQAGAARKVMAATPDRAREALLAVEASGRAAMAELRHAMGLLTMDDGDRGGASDKAGAAPDLAPQPGLGQLDALVARVREAGLPVELTVSGTPRPVPSGIGLAAYRMVQEALTNTVKHAVGSTAEVTVAYGDDQLRVAVTDTGGTPSASAAAGGGRGLIGLHERLSVYGGTLHTGPRPGGGYRVEATIPLEEMCPLEER
ncbi:putative two-component system sensor kinase [Streptomyces bingchenggensis BCW-1]|uniref:histidine kinase n=2 Tax=Streptomyces TaxID=1883 RepID=D7CCH4_STRBB|nr:putative two-component system sensor kinase [Streptomyces bingchenggensis BCW-1]